MNVTKSVHHNSMMNEGSSSTQEISKSTSVFDYKAVRDIYWSKLSPLVDSDALKLRPYTRLNIKKIVKLKKKLEKEGEFDKTVFGLDMYDLSKYNGEDWLTVKQYPSGRKTVIPLEDSLGILVAIHVNNVHQGGQKYIESCLHAQNLSMPKMFITHFLAACNVCKSNLMSCREEVKVALVPLDIKCEQFTHWLIYQDVATTFYLLRPLNATDGIKDIAEFAIELTKIFCDFGVPNVISYNSFEDLTALRLYLHGILKAPFKLPEFKYGKDYINIINKFNSHSQIFRECILEKLNRPQGPNFELRDIIYPQLLQWDMNKDVITNSFKKMFVREQKSSEIINVTDQTQNIVRKCCICHDTVYQERYCYMCKKCTHVICGRRFTVDTQIVLLCVNCDREDIQMSCDNPNELIEWPPHT